MAPLFPRTPDILILLWPSFALYNLSEARGSSVVLGFPFISIAIEMLASDGVHGTVCNAQQYEESLLLLSNPEPQISCMTHAENIGLMVSTLFISFVTELSSRNPRTAGG
jgi:hypothetical protein